QVKEAKQELTIKYLKQPWKTGRRTGIFRGGDEASGISYQVSGGSENQKQQTINNKLQIT
ncbi:MAG TPA: hypothetical protein VFV68_14850, partial [Agriterribacter sp.]|nr:hypothetical protein [Agriterribacter sp.]